MHERVAKYKDLEYLRRGPKSGMSHELDESIAGTHILEFFPQSCSSSAASNRELNSSVDCTALASADRFPASNRLRMNNLILCLQEISPFLTFESFLSFKIGFRT